MFKIETTPEAITKQIKSISNRGKTWDKDVQTCALGIIKHVNEYHEVSLVNLLVTSMPKGARINALREWFIKHGKVEFNQEEQAFEPSREEPKDFSLAVEELWTELKPEPKFKEFDLEVELEKLIAKANKAQESNDERHNINGNLLNTLNLLTTPTEEV